MNQQENTKLNNHPSVIVDLPVTQAQAADVKGGDGGANGTWAVFWKGDRINP